MEDFVKVREIFEGWVTEIGDKELSQIVAKECQGDQEDRNFDRHRFDDCQEQDHEDWNDSGAELEYVGQTKDSLLFKAELVAFHGVDGIYNGADDCANGEQDVKTEEDNTANRVW